VKKVLFVCSQNRLRSPTAERIFSDCPELEVDSAGLNHDAVQVLSSEQIEWAEIIFVMEKAQKSKLQQRFKKYLKKQAVVCLDIPDEYAFMDVELISILRRKVGGYLGLAEEEI
jgi:predicted protein tyrosine phosphatase